MTRMWLPSHVGERYETIRRLKELGTYVAGAEQLDVSHLRDILQAEEEKAQVKKPPRPAPRFSREQVAEALKDYRDWQNAQKQGRRRLY